MTKPQHILVPTDFSPTANAARDYAAVLAGALGATLHVLHVMPDPLAMGWGVDAAYLPRLLDQTERTAREQLEGSLPGALREALHARYVVETGAPVDRIAAYAETNGIDLIVMGTQGRGAVERLWVGSVTHGVIRRASCPVVTVRPPSA